MIYNDPEVIEIGAAEELIQMHPDLVNTEGTDPACSWGLLPAYVADAE